MNQEQVEALLAELLEADIEVALLEPRSDLDQCIVGLGRRFHDTFLIYDQECVIAQFAKDMQSSPPTEECVSDPSHQWHSHDDDDEAREYFEFNTVGAWIGETTPVFLVTED